MAKAFKIQLFLKFQKTMCIFSTVHANCNSKIGARRGNRHEFLVEVYKTGGILHFELHHQSYLQPSITTHAL